MIDTKNLKKLKPTDLCEPYSQIAERIGMEKTIRLVTLIGGSSIYIRILDSVLTKAKKRMIAAEFNGSNYDELAIKYGLTSRWIREIIKKARVKKYDK